MTSLTLYKLGPFDVIKEEKMETEYPRPRSKMGDLLQSPHFLCPQIREEVEPNNKPSMPSVSIVDPEGGTPTDKFKKVSKLTSEPKLKEVVLMAVNKHKSEQGLEEPLRRKSGPSMKNNTLEVDEKHLVRRKSDVTANSVRVVRRKSSAHIQFRRHSMRPSIIANTAPDPLEFLTHFDESVVNKKPNGMLRRLASNFRSEHLSSLFSGVSIGVSAGLVVKTVLLLLTLLWTLGSG